MLKVRITYADEKELAEAKEILEQNFRVLNTSKVYPGRGDSQYSNIYLDVELKKDSVGSK